MLSHAARLRAFGQPCGRDAAHLEHECVNLCSVTRSTVLQSTKRSIPASKGRARQGERFGDACRRSSAVVSCAMSRDDEIRKEATKKITNLGRTNNPSEAVKALVDLGLQGVQPDAKVATATLAACVSCGQIQMARKVYEEIFGSKVVAPDHLVFETMIRGYMACEPPEWAKSEALLGEMETSFGLSPSAATFNALLEGCARTNNIEMGRKILSGMAANDVYPDYRTYEVIKRRKILRSHFKKVFA